jgi:hypothetical protein
MEEIEKKDKRKEKAQEVRRGGEKQGDIVSAKGI